jgi:hypothetical protein
MGDYEVPNVPQYGQSPTVRIRCFLLVVPPAVGSELYVIHEMA